MSGSKKTGIVLLTYGSATDAEGVPAFLACIYGKDAPAERIAEFERRYRLIGHSPLVEITGRQATLLEEKLGAGFVVRVGMRYSEPTILSAVSACKAAGATKLIGILLAPQQSAFITDGYRAAFLEAGRACGYDDAHITLAGAWPTEKYLIQILAERTKTALGELRARHDTEIPAIFTTHSLPKRVVESDPEYLEQLQSTIRAVIAHLDDPQLSWHAAYQSAGHTPGEWMKPDLTDVLDGLRGKVPAVLIAPIQFLTDHLEVLYDLDIAAKAECEERGIEYNRITLPNTDPLLVDALASLALPR
jgi:ferrochelatase